MIDVTELHSSAARREFIEIRVLGPLKVHRLDGSTVDPREWRTGKTVDLLRLLALHPDQPVAVEGIVAALWPASSHARGRASLRTAASQIRHILRRDCIERTPGGIRLRDVWVDVIAFRSLAAEVRRLVGTDEMTHAAVLARDADALYRGDLSAHDDSADWAQTERRAVAGIYQVLLCDAAEAAQACGRPTDAVDFAGRAVVVDPFGERGTRLLMQGYAELGEVSLALREYDRFRGLLANELGIDPSPQTRALHLQLLRSEHPAPAVALARSEPSRSAVARAEPGEPACLSDPETQAASRLQLALELCLPQRQFSRSRRCAQEAASLTTVPALRARAIAATCLPEVLLGRPREGAVRLTQALQLAAQSGDGPLQRSLEVLRCLVAHDLDSPSFHLHWAQAVAVCQSVPEANWAWLMVRVATERADLATARLAARLPLGDPAERMGRQLHALAVAALHTELGDTHQATTQLYAFIDTERAARSTLFLPEALARLVIAQAGVDVAAAEEQYAQLNLTLGNRPGLPREAYLRLMAHAAIHSARGRVTGAAAAAASAAEVAEDNGLRFLAAAAHEQCARYTARAQAQRGFCHPSTGLKLTLSAVSA